MIVSGAMLTQFFFFFFGGGGGGGGWGVDLAGKFRVYSVMLV